MTEPVIDTGYTEIDPSIDPAAAIWVEVLSRHGDVLARHRCAGPELRIGRGYGNDVVIDDPYVAVEHLVVMRDAEGRLIARDLGSVNGTFLDRDTRRLDHVVLDGEHRLRIGHTWLRIRDAAHAVPPERAMEPQRRLLPIALGLGAVVIGIEVLSIWLNDTQEPKPSRYLLTPLVVTLVLVVWTAVWSVLSRIFIGQAKLERNLLIAVAGALVYSLWNEVVWFFTYAFASRALIGSGPVVFWLVLTVICILHLRAISPAHGWMKAGAVLMLGLAGIGAQTLTASDTPAGSPYQGAPRRLLPPAFRVAPLADLNKERELALARRKSEFELAPLETRLVPVSYADARQIMPRAKDLLSPRGTVAVDERTNVLILRDITGNLNQVEELVRSLDTQTPQVLIEARIVEASSQFSREFGIQWGGGSVIGQDTGVDTGLAFPNRIGILGAADDAQTPSDGLDPNRNAIESPNFAVNLPAAVGGGTGGALGMTFGSVNNLFNLSVRLSAAESNGTVRIISSPRVLTLDNREARIATGTLIPFSQVSAQGVQTVFQEAKLQLLVKPHVTADGSVSMSVKINRDEPDFGNRSARGDPTIFKREVETELLVMDGHTAVIGGIYTRNTSRSIAQVPVLGDIPILGVLFQRRGSTDRRTELVVFITPRIVNRSESLGR